MKKAKDIKQMIYDLTGEEMVDMFGSDTDDIIDKMTDSEVMTMIENL